MANLQQEFFIFFVKNLQQEVKEGFHDMVRSKMNNISCEKEGVFWVGNNPYQNQVDDHPYVSL